MKLSSILTAAAALSLLVACNSLDNPIGNLFHHHTAHDDRVYNPQTGQWEWPPEKRAAHAGETPVPQGNDTRYWDAQRNQWVEGPAQRTASAQKTKPTTTGEGGESTPVPVTPPPPRPSRASGVYNASTGKIEWQSGGYVPSVAPTPEPKKKHWYWPF